MPIMMPWPNARSTVNPSLPWSTVSVVTVDRDPFCLNVPTSREWKVTLEILTADLVFGLAVNRQIAWSTVVPYSRP